LTPLADLLASIESFLWPVSGIVIGAALQYYASKAFDERKTRRHSRTQTYADFLRGSAGLAIAQADGDTERMKEYRILLTDAKARITIYGSKEVILATAEFFRAGGTLDTHRQMELYLSICEQMRKEGLPRESARSDDMSQLLFGTDLGEWIQDL
jgi:hypothetical protein